MAILYLEHYLFEHGAIQGFRLMQVNGGRVTQTGGERGPSMP
jgi:hypothetical protein